MDVKYSIKLKFHVYSLNLERHQQGDYYYICVYIKPKWLRRNLILEKKFLLYYAKKVFFKKLDIQKFTKVSTISGIEPGIYVPEKV